jgi:hypothetical protein
MSMCEWFVDEYTRSYLTNNQRLLHTCTMLNHFFHPSSHSSSHSLHSPNNPHSSHLFKKQYTLQGHPIGQGGSGEVIKASFKGKGKGSSYGGEEGEVVAVKVVRKEAIVDEQEYLRVLE